MKVEDLYEGKPVTYVPNHAHGNASHPDCERGVVTSWGLNSHAGGITVFVRYGAQPNSKGTALENLVEG